MGYKRYAQKDKGFAGRYGRHYKLREVNGGVEIAILFRETGTDERVKVSFRSKGEADVNKLAGVFNGGGHPTASGCSVFGKFEDVEKKVLDAAKEMIK